MIDRLRRLARGDWIYGDATGTCTAEMYAIYPTSSMHLPSLRGVYRETLLQTLSGSNSGRLTGTAVHTGLSPVIYPSLGP
jgi:hypothetical protein